MKFGYVSDHENRPVMPFFRFAFWWDYPAMADLKHLKEIPAFC
jgi:hypothetical protein